MSLANEIVQEEIAKQEVEYKTIQSRKQRREQERQLIKDGIAYKEQLIRSIKRNTDLINDLTQLYCKSYNDYADMNKSRNNGLDMIRLRWQVVPTKISLLELKKSSSSLDMTEFMKCTDPINPASVNLFYLRVDFEMVYSKDVDKNILTTRPDVPEEIIDNNTGDGRFLKRQLFYHAVFPKPDELELTKLKAEDKLLADFISHIFCSGIDMQHSHNNRMWDQRIQKQVDNLHDKGEEVMKIFEEAALKKD